MLLYFFPFDISCVGLELKCWQTNKSCLTIGWLNAMNCIHVLYMLVDSALSCSMNLMSLLQSLCYLIPLHDKKYFHVIFIHPANDSTVCYLQYWIILKKSINLSVLPIFINRTCNPLKYWKGLVFLSWKLKYSGKFYRDQKLPQSCSCLNPA